MISKRKILAGFAGLALTVGTMGAVSASASGPGAGACVVTGGTVVITACGFVVCVGARRRVHELVERR